MGTSSLLYNEPPLVVSPSLAVALGLNEAIVCQQLHFWLGNKNVGIERNGYKWIHNTYEQWKENFPFWSERTIQRIFVELEKRGVVVSAQFNSATWDKTKFYRIDYEWLEQIKNTPRGGTGGGTIEDDKLALSDDANLSSSSGDIDYKEAETTEESLSFRKSTELEKLSSVAQPEIVSPLSVSELEPALQTSNGVMSTSDTNSVYVAVEQDPALVFAHQFPDAEVELDEYPFPSPNATYPVKVKAKSGKAASPAPPKPKKEPKPPRELDPREAEFLAQVTKIDPFMGKQVEGRLRKYRRDKPWSAIQVYLLIGKAVPPASLQAVTSLNGTAFDTELMLKCLSVWVSKGWSPMNLAWLLEWYKAGGPPQYKSNGYAQQPAQQPAPVPSKPELVFDDPLVEDVAQWVYALPGYKGKGLYDIQLGMWNELNGKPQQHLGNAKALLAEYIATH